MRKLRPCQLCGKNSRNAKYCSRRCAGLASHKKELNPEVKMCAECKLNESKPGKYSILCEDCFSKSVHQKGKLSNLVCLQCDVEFKSLNTRQIYCSNECYSRAKASRHYTKYGSPIKGEGICKNCGEYFLKKSNNNQTHCSAECATVSYILSKDLMTVGPIREKYKDKKYGQLNLHTSVRGRAREKILTLGLNFCMMCGYDKAVHACHIREIIDFSDSATIGQINSVQNLLALCPNHHNELDKLKIITVDMIKDTEYYLKAISILNTLSRAKQKLITADGATVSAGLLNK